MDTLKTVWHYLLEFPEFLPAVQAAGAVLLIAVPIYLALWYFLSRREITVPLKLQIAFFGVFAMFAGLAFLFASPWANQIYSILRVYLFITCVLAAYGIVALLDIFFIQYYLVRVKQVYISPPLQKILSFTLFCLAVLPILRYVLNFNPFTLVAIPTIITAGIALAFQDTLKAFIAGVGLGQVVRVGDWVAFQDKEGRVVDINWGRVALRTIDGDVLYIPNTMLLAQPFLNLSINRAHRMTLRIGVSYKADPAQVKLALERSTEKITGVAAFPKSTAHVMSFDTPVITYALYYWIDDYGNRLELQDKVSNQVWNEVKREGFEMPFPFPVYSLKANVAKSHPLKPAPLK